MPPVLSSLIYPVPELHYQVINPSKGSCFIQTGIKAELSEDSQAVFPSLAFKELYNIITCMVYKFSYSRRNNLQVILCFITFFLTALSDAWNKELTAPCPFISYVILSVFPIWFSSTGNKFRLHLLFSLNLQNHCRWRFLLYTKVSNELLGPVSEAVNTSMLIPFLKNACRLHKDQPLISFVFIITHEGFARDSKICLTLSLWFREWVCVCVCVCVYFNITRKSSKEKIFTKIIWNVIMW